jgi:type VII secretion integral membrane protein EccD
MCRLTVHTPDRRCDVALPVGSSIGELLPLVFDETRLGTEPGAWVIQRLGGPALDPGATPESLGLGDGAVLFVNPVSAPLPEAEFDDVSVGVAEIVGARADQWRPEFSRYLLLAAALLAAGTLCAVSAGARAHPFETVWCAAVTVGLTVWAVLAGRFADDRVAALVSGVGAVAAGAFTGLVAADTKTGLLTVDRRSVLLLGVCALVPAAVTAALGRLPATVFGTTAAWAAAATIVAALDFSFGWTPAQSAAVLAVVLFAAGGRAVRAVLRLARLRVPLLPRTAVELQQDIDPELHARVAERSTRAVAYLNILFITTALLTAAACVLLVRQAGWIGWTLASVLSVAVLLRSAAVTSAWQRAPLALAGLLGLSSVAVARSGGAGSVTRELVLLGLLLVTIGLYVASRLMPGRRTLPVWGHLADLLETWSAAALIPLLLELFHLYTHIRAQIH